MYHSVLEVLIPNANKLFNTLHLHPVLGSSKEEICCWSGDVFATLKLKVHGDLLRIFRQMSN